MIPSTRSPERYLLNSVSENERVLVIAPAWVGDMVMAQSLLRTLAKRRPGVAIGVVAPAWTLPLAGRMPEVSHAYEMPLRHGELGLRRRLRLARRLGREAYTQAIVLPGSFKAALIPFLARIPCRTGYRGELRYGLINDMRSQPRAAPVPTVASYVALGLRPGEPIAEIPKPRLGVDRENQARLLRELDLKPETRAVGLVPGAEYGPAKRWPLGHFQFLARALAASGRQVWVFGSRQDAGIGEGIAASLRPGQAIDLCGRTRLEDAIDLLAATSAVVSNDSGLMHVAAALGRPVVALFGSSSPWLTPPLSEQARVLSLGLPCSPCFRRECPYGHTRCLVGLAPDAVLRALAGLEGEEGIGALA